VIKYIVTIFHLLFSPNQQYALVLSRLDYANSVLTGLPAYLVKRLQSVLIASARLIYELRRFYHVSEALMSLHWLRIPQRIQFKLAVLVHQVLRGNAPEYPRPFTRLSNVPSLSSLRSSSSSRPASSSLDCWFKGVSGGWASSLEQFACWHYVDWQSASFS